MDPTKRQLGDLCLREGAKNLCHVSPLGFELDDVEDVLGRVAGRRKGVGDEAAGAVPGERATFALRKAGGLGDQGQRVGSVHAQAIARQRGDQIAPMVPGEGRDLEPRPLQG